MPAWLDNFAVGADGQYYDAATGRAYVPIYSSGHYDSQDSYTAGQIVGYRGYAWKPGMYKDSVQLEGTSYDTYDARGNWTGTGTWKGLAADGLFGHFTTNPGLGAFSVISLPFAVAGLQAALGTGAAGAGGAGAAAGGGVSFGSASAADIGTMYAGADAAGAASLGGGASVAGGAALGGSAVLGGAGSLVKTAASGASSLLSSIGSVASSVLGTAANAAIQRAAAGGSSRAGAVQPQAYPVAQAEPAARTDWPTYLFLAGVIVGVGVIFAKSKG